MNDFDIEFKNCQGKEMFARWYAAFEAKYGVRAKVVEDVVWLIGLTCEELENAFENTGMLEMGVLAIHKRQNSFLWENDNDGGYGESPFFLEWDGEQLKADVGSVPYNEWSDE